MGRGMGPAGGHRPGLRKTASAAAFTFLILLLVSGSERSSAAPATIASPSGDDDGVRGVPLPAHHHHQQETGDPTGEAESLIDHVGDVDAKESTAERGSDVNHDGEEASEDKAEVPADAREAPGTMGKVDQDDEPDEGFEGFGHLPRSIVEDGADDAVASGDFPPSEEGSGAPDTGGAPPADSKNLRMKDAIIREFGNNNPFRVEDGEMEKKPKLTDSEKAALFSKRYNVRESYPMYFEQGPGGGTTNPWKESSLPDSIRPLDLSEQGHSTNVATARSIDFSDLVQKGGKLSAGRPAAPGMPSSPTKPMAPIAIPVKLPPISAMICELLCLVGGPHETCNRPCNYAIACGMRTVVDQNIMEKLMPRGMLEVDSETFDLYERYDQWRSDHTKKAAGGLEGVETGKQYSLSEVEGPAATGGGGEGRDTGTGASSDRGPDRGGNDSSGSHLRQGESKNTLDDRIEDISSLAIPLVTPSGEVHVVDKNYFASAAAEGAAGGKLNESTTPATASSPGDLLEVQRSSAPETTTDKPFSLEEALAMPLSNATRDYLLSVSSDDLCHNDPMLCMMRDILTRGDDGDQKIEGGADELIALVQTYMSTTAHAMAGVSVGATARVATRAAVENFLFKLVAMGVKGLCERLDAWPPVIQPGYCGYLCKMAMQEHCISLCLADHACCGLWHCLQTPGGVFGNLKKCSSGQFCWTKMTMGCDHNIADLTTISKMFAAPHSSLQNPYGYPGGKARWSWDKGPLKVVVEDPEELVGKPPPGVSSNDVGYVRTPTRIDSYQPEKMFKFWLPPNRLNGKALGAVSLSRYGMYPYVDNNKFMAMGIGFNGERMAGAVVRLQPMTSVDALLNQNPSTSPPSHMRSRVLL